MIGYVTVGTNDLERAIAFYDSLLAELGIKRMWTQERRAAWGDPSVQALLVTRPADGERATPGNGAMVALLAASPEHIGKVYAKALSLGAKDEGPPGYRGADADDPRFYGAYFRDLDGNKFAVFCMTPKG
ncbi:MAG: VOC family protein [Caulobacteraceae bacterium]